jgi:2-isopropylmalate synthase
LTARSGRAALKHRLELLGFHPSKTELDTLYEAFLVVADEKKNVNDEDLTTLVANTPVLIQK